MEQIENPMLIDKNETRRLFAICEQCGKPIQVGKECVLDTRCNSYLHEECLDRYIKSYVEATFIRTTAEDEI